ncbi:MAG: hypothetical protein AB1791_21515 [Chloroflexota bacterium]
MHQQPPYFRTYTLRIWSTEGRGRGGANGQRYSLERVGANARRGFSDLKELLTHLQAEINGDLAEVEDQT